MFCKKCGMQLPEGAAVCPGCGEAVSGGFERGAASIKKMFSQREVLESHVWLLSFLGLVIDSNYGKH